MAKEYQVRDKNGVLKFTMAERLALNAIAAYRGEFRTATYQSGRKVNQYVLEENNETVITHQPSGEQIRFHFLAGDTIDIAE